MEEATVDYEKEHFLNRKSNRPTFTSLWTRNSSLGCVQVQCRLPLPPASLEHPLHTTELNRRLTRAGRGARFTFIKTKQPQLQNSAIPNSTVKRMGLLSQLCRGSLVLFLELVGNPERQFCFVCPDPITPKAQGYP